MYIYNVYTSKKEGMSLRKWEKRLGLMNACCHGDILRTYYCRGDYIVCYDSIAHLSLLLQCPTQGVGVHNCVHFEDAGSNGNIIIVLSSMLYILDQQWSSLLCESWSTVKLY